MDFERMRSDRIHEIDELLARYMPSADVPQKQLIDSMQYSLFSFGKRLRPMLMQEVYAMYRGSEKVIDSFMTAIEMIHTYSLVHDDLPAMDNDDLRRGQKTNHKIFGEACAILAGDGLLNQAFEVGLTGFAMTQWSDRVIESLKILAAKAGTSGMIGGQIMDLENEGRLMRVDEEDLADAYVPKVIDHSDTRAWDARLRDTIERKTGALIEASMMIGAMLATGDAAEVERMEEVGKALGVAFQMQDDLLDVVGDEEKLGKRIGSDQKNDKVTFATIYDADTLSRMVEVETNRALMLLAKAPGQNDYLVDLITSLVTRER